MTKNGVILTGGGARAAYQVGVLRAIADMYPDWSHPFNVIIGTLGRGDQCHGPCR